jgi:hypothetical protein
LKFQTLFTRWVRFGVDLGIIWFFHQIKKEQDPSSWNPEYFICCHCIHVIYCELRIAIDTCLHFENNSVQTYNIIAYVIWLYVVTINTLSPEQLYDIFVGFSGCVGGLLNCAYSCMPCWHYEILMSLCLIMLLGCLSLLQFTIEGDFCISFIFVLSLVHEKMFLFGKGCHCS